MPTKTVASKVPPREAFWDELFCELRGALQRNDTDGDIPYNEYESIADDAISCISENVLTNIIEQESHMDIIKPFLIRINRYHFEMLDDMEKRDLERIMDLIDKPTGF